MLNAIFSAGEVVAHEIALFAAIGFLFLGAGDVAVDLIWIGLRAKRLLRARHPRADNSGLPRQASGSGPLAIFVPAWDEAPVIGGMLSCARTAFGDGDYRIYVGCYPNDPATLAAVTPFVGARIHVVPCQRPGPTSKADCLNQLWARMCADEVVGIM
jgi:adsorption protein B